MSVSSLAEVEVGTELPAFTPDTTMDNVRRFCAAAGWDGPRFTDHEAARKEGFDGAIVPGIMSQGILAAAIHRFVPGATLRRVDTVFRAPVLVDSSPLARGVVTHVDADTGTAEIDLTLVNEAGETRVLGTAVVKLPA